MLRDLVNGVDVSRPTCSQRQADACLNGDPSAEQFGAPLRILLVEDNRVNLTEVVLMKRGHHVTIASDGRDGVYEVTRQRFDVVLMGIQMPVMDGWEATAAIRASERESGVHLPIIAMTAHALAEEIDRCRAVGKDGYVSKPFQIEDPLKALERVRRMQAATRPPV